MYQQRGDTLDYDIQVELYQRTSPRGPEYRCLLRRHGKILWEGRWTSNKAEAINNAQRAGYMMLLRNQ